MKLLTRNAFELRIKCLNGHLMWKTCLPKYVSVMQANNRYAIGRTLDLVSIMDIRVWEPAETASERILFVCILFYHVIEFEWAVTWRHHALTVTTVTMQTVTESCPLSITPLDRALSNISAGTSKISIDICRDISIISGKMKSEWHNVKNAIYWSMSDERWKLEKISVPSHFDRNIRILLIKLQ